VNKEQRIIVYKTNNIIKRIKEFFKDLFNKFKKQKYSYKKEKIVYEYNNSFKKDIVIKQDKQKLRVLKLQQDYKNGLIQEEDISKEDYQRLLKLYDEQNNKIKEEIEIDKIEIKMMLEQLKNKNSI